MGELGIGGGGEHSCWVTEKMMFVVVRREARVEIGGVSIDVNSLGYTGNLAVRDEVAFDYLGRVGPLAVLKRLAAKL